MRNGKTVAIDGTNVWDSAVICFMRRVKTVAIDGTDVWDSDMIYK